MKQCCDQCTNEKCPVLKHENHLENYSLSSENRDKWMLHRKAIYLVVALFGVLVLLFILWNMFYCPKEDLLLRTNQPEQVHLSLGGKRAFCR